MPSPEAESMKECLQQWHLERHNSPWRRVSAESDGAIALIRDLTGMKPVPGLHAYAIAPAGPLLALDEEGDRLVANGYVFESLRRVDATSVTGPEAVGILSDLGLESISGQRMVSFLLESEIIQTYAHMESTLCLIEQADTDDIYRADLKGSHIYFTNERNEAPLSFSILINRGNGEIQVLPRDI
tara:strand:+ start:291107 stop:291661 length:555 start_codon:yes stop_codon:yes gene_type:complete